MANSKITDLTEILLAASDDVLVIVDISADETKKIKISDLKSSLVLTKSDVGLSNVDNTSDIDKPISTATQTALNLKYDASNPAGYITLSEVPASPVVSVNGQIGDVIIDKSSVGLSEVDNTSDADKPISTATQTALDLKYDASNPSGYITLTEVPPDLVSSVASKVGDVVLDKVDVGLDQVDNTSDVDKPISTATQSALDNKYDSSNPAGYITLAEVPAFPVTSVNTKIGDVTLDKTDIGLSNVDNTSDANKPISTATQTALNAKQDISEKNQPNGYVGLESDSKISSIYLPSYVDDVVEVADFASLPDPGEVSKIYITLDNSKCYRYSGSVYVEISPSDVNSVNGKVGIVVLTKTDIGLSNVDNTSDIDKPVSTAVQNELDLKVNKGGDALGGPLQWTFALTNGTTSQTYECETNADKIRLESYWNNGNPTRKVEISSYAIYATTDNQPSVPLLDSELINKKYADDALNLKYDASNPAGYITLAEVPADAVTSVNTQTGDVVLTKTDIGLDQVDNTSDADKPVSTATQLALDSKISKDGDNVNAALIWQDFGMQIPSAITYTVTNQVKSDSIELSVVYDNGDPTPVVRIDAGGITASLGSNPATPSLDSHLVTKKYTDDGLATKSNTDHTHTNATTSTSGFMSATDKTKLENISGRVIGPGQLISFSDSLYEQSNYAPGITPTSNPADFGFFPVFQNLNFVFNPFLVLGENKNYRIKAIFRKTNVQFDGVHCLIRQFPEGAAEVGIPGLLDFGAGGAEYATATSDILNSGSSSQNIWYRTYFAAYAGANQARIQDVTLYIEEVL